MLEYSGEHLAYEVQMLRGTAELLRGPELLRIVNNAVVESFGLHLRNLVKFLYDDRPEVDDVVAGDFFDDPEEWKQMRPELPEPLREARTRANKELAHLTTRRKGLGDPGKGWAPDLAGPVFDAFRVFGKFASPTRLHSNGALRRLSRPHGNGERSHVPLSGGNDLRRPSWPGTGVLGPEQS